ncbi:hypothetical protein ACO0SA_003065 [Hanseniaspora valbyensis]
MSSEQEIINTIEQQVSESGEYKNNSKPIDQEQTLEKEEEDLQVEQESEEQLLQQEQLKEIIVEGEEDAFKNVQKGLDGKYKQLLIDFWQNLIDDIQSLNDNILILQNEQFLTKFNNMTSNEDEDEEVEDVEEMVVEIYEEPSGNDNQTDTTIQPVTTTVEETKTQQIEEDENKNKTQTTTEEIKENGETNANYTKNITNNETEINPNEETYNENIKPQNNTAKASFNYQLHQQLSNILLKEEAAMKQLTSIIYSNKEEEECDPYKQNKLPLARIKKLMKFDNELKMISSETPILFSKVCEVFIQELTLRAWSIVDSDKRRTVQKQDILNALTKSDMYDFLVDLTSR